MNERQVTTRGVTGLVAILRGVTPEEVLPIADVLRRSGFSAIEVPLNSPDPFTSIGALRAEMPADVLVGAGTVLTTEDVRRAADVGSDIVVAPNCDTAVIEEAVRLGMAAYPGVATASEAFDAVHSGAKALKLFPSHQVGIKGMRAWADVLPKDVEFIPVGGVGPDQIEEWVRAGATGFGLGSSLYTAGASLETITAKAQALSAAWTAAEAFVTPRIIEVHP